MEVALAARLAARERKDFAQSDAIRDGLIAAGIEIKDTPTGVQWNIAT
jgi:cysteinyl-tRNA synthetase